MRAGPGQVGPARGFQPAARVRTQGCGRAGADKRRAPVQGRPGRGSWPSRRGGQSASRRSENSQVQWYFVTQHSEWTRKSATEDFFLLAGVLAQSRAGQARPAAPVTFPEVTGGHGTSREVTGSHGAVAVGHGDECQINRRGAGAHITDGSPGRGARTRPGATRTAKGAGPARAPARPGGAPGRQERRRRDRLGRTYADPVGRAEVAGAGRRGGKDGAPAAGAAASLTPAVATDCEVAPAPLGRQPLGLGAAWILRRRPLSAAAPGLDH